LPHAPARQGKEVWACHGEWLKRHNPKLGPGIKDRFEWASTITQEQWAAADAQRQK
jgi:amidase